MPDLGKTLDLNHNSACAWVLEFSIPWEWLSLTNKTEYICYIIDIELVCGVLETLGTLDLLSADRGR